VANLSDISIKIVVNNSQAEAALTQTENKLKSFSNAAQAAESPIAKFAKGFIGIGSAIAVADGLVRFTKNVIAAGEESQRSDARLEQIAKSMGLFGGATSAVTTHLKDFADQQARLTGVDDDVIKAAQAKLLTFANLATSAGVMGGAFERATKATVDLAAAGFGEATQNAVQLGKALQDPIKGITALARSGITFTEQEKAKIKTLVESNHMLDAQNMVLSAIETQVGGTAAASATASDKMKVAYGQVEEAIGIALLPMMNKLADWFTETAPQVEQFFKDLNDPTTETGKNWGIITRAVEDFGTAWANMYSAIKPIVPIIAGLASSMFVLIIDKVTLAIAALSDLANAFGRLGNDFQRSLKGDFSWLTETTDFFKNYNAAQGSIANRAASQQAATRQAAQQADARAEYDRLHPGSTGVIAPAATTSGTKTTAIKNTPAATVLAYIIATNEKIAAAQNTFNEAQAKAQDTYDKAVVKATSERDKATEALDKQHAKNVLAINTQFNAQFASIIQQSMDLLRNAFAQGTSFDVGSTFGTMLGKVGVAMTQVTQTIKNGVSSVVSFWGTTASAGVDDLLSTMQTKLSAMKDLQANAAKLQGAGFSQAFIAQVVQAGPEVGNQLAGSILGSSADTQKAMSDTFNSIQDISQNGLNGLAKTIYDTQGLQTDALKSMFTQAQSDLATALADETDSYTQAQKDIKTKFDEAISSAHQTMVDSIASAAQTLYDALNNIENEFNAKLLTFKGSLAAFAAQIADVRNQLNSGMSAASALLPAPVYNSQGFTTSGNASAPGSFMNTVGYNNSVTINAQTNASPATIGDAVAFAIRNGSPYTYNQIMDELHGT
jgi:hypothetical protein